MNSFYGGKQGRTYHIVARYDSVSDMVDCFSQGGAYTDANYGQYVLIDTILKKNKKSSLENGLLYRRGFNYNEGKKSQPSQEDKDENNNYIYKDENNHLLKDTWQKAWSAWAQNPGGGAIYVGQIVGSQGESPEVIPVNYDSIKDTAGVYKVIPTSSTMGNDNTVVGKDGNNDILNGDTIKVASLTIKDAAGNVTGAKIAFDIPKLVQQAIIDTNAYAKEQEIGVKEVDTENHPFWYKWKFTIPRGKNGQDIEQIKVETGSVIGQGVDGFNNPLENDDQYFTYKTRNYTDSAEGAVTKHLGRWPYRVIKEINQNNPNRIYFNSWVSGTTVQTGTLYKIGDDTDPQYVAVCIKAGQVGNLPEFTQEIGREFSSGDTTWLVTTLPEAAPANELIIDYTAGENNTVAYKQVNYVYVDDTGKMFITYSDQQPNIKHYLTQVRSIASAETVNGQMIIHYNDGSSNTFSVVQGLSITYEEGGEDYDPITSEYDSAFKISYWQNGVQSKNIYRIKKINRIIAIDLKGDCVIALYSDPFFRNSLTTNPNPIIKDWTSPTGKEYKNLNWCNLGPIGGQYHINGEYKYCDLAGNSQGQGFTIDLSNGFTGDLADRMGWLVTVTDKNNNKHIYAYDYNDKTANGKYIIGDINETFNSHWYEVMNISSSIINPNLFTLIAQEDQYGLPVVEEDHLQEDGIWFVVSDGHEHNNSGS